MIHRGTQIDRFRCCCSFAYHPAISGCVVLGGLLLVIVAFRCPLFTSALCERKPEPSRSTTQNISNFHFVFFDASVQQSLPFLCVRVCASLPTNDSVTMVWTIPSQEGTPLHTAYSFSFMRRGKSNKSEEGNPAAATASGEKPAEEKQEAPATTPHPYENSIKSISTVKTVEQFWSTYNYLKRPNDLSSTTDYHFFRDGIKPTWEDPKNAKGGKWIVSGTAVVEIQWHPTSFVHANRFFACLFLDLESSLAPVLCVFLPP